MNIGIIQSVIGSIGGNDRVLMSLLNILSKSEHNITIYTIGTPRTDLSIYKIKKIVKLFPIKIPLFGIYQKLLEPMLAKKAKHEDLLISLTGDMFLPADKNQRTLFYSQNNYSDPTKTDTSKYKNGMWKYYYLPYKKMIQKFNRDFDDYNVEFIANSNYVKDQLKKGLGVDAGIIYPPVNLIEFKNAKTENKEGTITVCRYSKEKNLETMIDMMDSNSKNTMFGNVTETNKPYLNKLREIGKPKNVNFIVNEDRSKMVEQLSKSKVFISTSDETFGIAVVEAISSGCIPIVSDTSAHKETVPYLDLRYNPNDIESAKTKIKKALMGEYDMYLPELKNHIEQYDTTVFEKKILEVIENE
jgi:glycosyltransferase involved in cell wall biosynthesis